MRTRRRAFALRELFVVVTLLCVILAILMPMIESAREASRRMSCSNNLKQIGLALHNYHAAYKQLPSAMWGTKANRHRLSGLIALTPFVEASPYWDRVSNPMTVGARNYPPLGPVPWDTNYPPWCEKYPTYRCPSDASTGPKLARTNYAFSVGDRVRDLYSCQVPNDVRGVFAPGMVTKFREVLDGLSNTIMATEIGSRRGSRLQGQFALNLPPGLADSPSMCLKVIDPDAPMHYDPKVKLSEIGRGGAMADGAGGYALVNMVLPPNSPSCAIGAKDPHSGVFSAGSYHTDGCNVLMADGAVVYITRQIDTGDASLPSPTVSRQPGKVIKSPYGLWGILGTRDGHETIEEHLVE